MSNEIIFLLFVMAPLSVFGLLMVAAQRKFLKSFRKIINPDKPILTEEIMKLFVKKVQEPTELLKFLKNDFNNYPSTVIKLYWQHYTNPKLEREASLVRRFTTLTIVVPAIGFIFSFVIALTR